MTYPTPRLEIYPDRIRSNAQHIVTLCHSQNIRVAAVTKVVSAHPAVVKALNESGVDLLADSRLENLEAIRQQGVQKPFDAPCAFQPQARWRKSSGWLISR